MSSKTHFPVRSTKDRESHINFRLAITGSTSASIMYCSDPGATLSGTSPGTFYLTLGSKNYFAQTGAQVVTLNGLATAAGQYEVHAHSDLTSGSIKLELFRVSGSNIVLECPASNELVQVNGTIIGRNTTRKK